MDLLARIAPGMNDTPAALPAAELLARAAARWPERDAVVFGDRRLTYAGLDRAASRVAQALIAAGLGRGHIVAMLSHNRIEYPVYPHGRRARRHAAGASFRALHRRRSRACARQVRRRSGVRRSARCCRNLRAARPHCPGAQDRDRAGRARRRTCRRRDRLGRVPSPAPPIRRPQSRSIPPKPFCITFTGGTTGFPKGVVASHGARSLIAMTWPSPSSSRPATPRCCARRCSTWPASARGSIPRWPRARRVVMLPNWDPADFSRRRRARARHHGFMVPTMINAAAQRPRLRARSAWRPPPAQLRRLADAAGAAGARVRDAAAGAHARPLRPVRMRRHRLSPARTRARQAAQQRHPLQGRGARDLRPRRGALRVVRRREDRRGRGARADHGHGLSTTTPARPRRRSSPTAG